MTRALIAIAALAACSHPDPASAPDRHEKSTERLVYSAPDDFLEEAEKAADEWSQATGLELVVDNGHPWATPIQWLPTVYDDETGDRLLGGADVTTRGDSFVGCSISLTFDATEKERRRAIRHEIGHCLAYNHSHHQRANCVMHELGGDKFCPQDAELVTR